MTARHQLRIGNRRLGRDRAAIDATPAPRVGETLQLARERKGVDLFRAERDTKIRLRYLSALEDGDYGDLPSAVYTKGFLRNYAIYLGLDPDEILERWRDEMDALRAAERVVIAPPPRPLAAPGRRVTFTPGMFVAGLVALVIIGFVGYLAVQFMRYAEAVPVALTYPPNVYTEINAEAVTLEGTAGAGATITITGPGGQLYTTTADEEGEWSREVILSPGRNDFSVVANDFVTRRDSDPLNLILVVPLPTASQAPGASPTAAPPVALTVSLLSPQDNFNTTGSEVTVRGTTTGTRLTITTLYLGPASAPSPAADPTQEPSLSTTPTPLPSAAPIGPARDVTVPVGGNFSETLTFDPGRWELTVTGYASGVAPVAHKRTITVAEPLPTDVRLMISVGERDSWVRILADGVKVPGYGGRTLRSGETHTATALSEICLRAGNAVTLSINVNGVDLGQLGSRGEAGSWIIRAGQQPERAPEPC